MKEFDQINLDSQSFEEENLQSEMDKALEGTVEPQQDYTGIACSGVGSASCQTGCKDGCKESGKTSPCQPSCSEGCSAGCKQSCQPGNK